jgi:hypothetical protein
MKNYSPACCAMIVLLGVILLAFDSLLPKTSLSQSTSQESGRPLVWLDRQDVDLGVVAPNATIPVTVRIENRGSKRLIVRSDDACASCNSHESNADPYLAIQPGSEQILGMTFVAPPEPGPIVQNRTFVTNDHQLLKFSIAVRATVRSTLD